MVTAGDGVPQNPTDVTLSGATAVGYSGTGYKTYWLAYGIQMQWGVGAPYSEGYSVTTLPISFSNADFALMITNANLYAGTFISGAPISKTQVKIWNDTYSDAYNFFAVGYQRSGD